MEPLVELPNATGSGQSKMAAGKFGILLSQPVHKTATKFQRLYLCFRSQAIYWVWWQRCTTKREETGGGKSKMVVGKLETRRSQLVHKKISEISSDQLRQWAENRYFG